MFFTRELLAVLEKYREILTKKIASSYQLSEKTKQAISRNVGIPYEELINMDWDDIDKHIENKTGKKLTYDTRLWIDGIPLDENHILTREKADRRLDEISGTSLSLKKRIQTIFRKKN